MRNARKNTVALSFVRIAIAIDIKMPNVQNVRLDHHQKATMIHRTDVNRVM